MLNATLVGNLGRDPDMRKTDDGKSVLNISVGCSIRRKGEKTTQWVSCNMWGKRAEAVYNYLEKGKKVAVTGTIYVDTWMNKDGVEKSTLRCEMKDIEILGPRTFMEGEDNRGNYAPDDMKF